MALRPAQISVIATNPIFTDGSEEVEGDAIFERFHAVSRVRRNLQRITLLENGFAIVKDESQPSALQVCHLLIFMLMARHERAFPEYQPSHRDSVAMYGLS